VSADEPHVCQHMCLHVVAETEHRGCFELRGCVPGFFNIVTDFIAAMKASVAVVRINAHTYLAGGKHYDHWCRLERRDGKWWRATGFGGFELDAPKLPSPGVLTGDG
jgi:hypothetical protein